jgi:hypothetical protein
MGSSTNCSSKVRLDDSGERRLSSRERSEWRIETSEPPGAACVVSIRACVASQRGATQPTQAEQPLRCLNEQMV